MPVNADKPHLWKADIAKSVDCFNRWFMKFAPKAFREERLHTTKSVEQALVLSGDLSGLSWELLETNPRILPAMRMCCCPPLARDRLIGLSGANKSLVLSLEKGKLPQRMSATALKENLGQIVAIICRMLDEDIFPWLSAHRSATRTERYRASTIVADRLCGAVADPIIRNAQEKRQLQYIGSYLKRKGYVQQAHPPGQQITEMTPGTFAFRMIVIGGGASPVNIPVDVVIQPKRLKPSRLPILIEAKSAGDFANVNKRRKEEATKVHQLRSKCGPDVEFILFLCGYFDAGYLGYEAHEGIDWIWEHRIQDLDQLGI